MKHYFCIFMLLLIVFAGCSSNTIEYFQTQEEALQNGLKQEDISQEKIIGNENFHGETIIIFENSE